MDITVRSVQDNNIIELHGLIEHNNKNNIELYGLIENTIAPLLGVTENTIESEAIEPESKEETGW